MFVFAEHGLLPGRLPPPARPTLAAPPCFVVTKAPTPGGPPFTMVHLAFDNHQEAQAGHALRDFRISVRAHAAPCCRRTGVALTAQARAGRGSPKFDPPECSAQRRREMGVHQPRQGCVFPAKLRVERPSGEQLRGPVPCYVDGRLHLAQGPI